MGTKPSLLATSSFVYLRPSLLSPGANFVSNVAVPSLLIAYFLMNYRLGTQCTSVPSTNYSCLACVTTSPILSVMDRVIFFLAGKANRRWLEYRRVRSPQSYQSSQRGGAVANHCVQQGFTQLVSGTANPKKTWSWFSVHLVCLCWGGHCVEESCLLLHLILHCKSPSSSSHSTDKGNWKNHLFHAAYSTFGCIFQTKRQMIGCHCQPEVIAAC